MCLAPLADEARAHVRALVAREHEHTRRVCLAPLADEARAHVRALVAREHEHVRIQNVRDFAQTKPDSEINAPFLSNEHGDPRFFFRYLLRTV